MAALLDALLEERHAPALLVALLALLVAVTCFASCFTPRERTTAMTALLRHLYLTALLRAATGILKKT